MGCGVKLPILMPGEILLLTVLEMRGLAVKAIRPSPLRFPTPRIFGLGSNRQIQNTLMFESKSTLKVSEQSGERVLSVL